MDVSLVEARVGEAVWACAGEQISTDIYIHSEGYATIKKVDKLY